MQRKLQSRSAPARGHSGAKSETLKETKMWIDSGRDESDLKRDVAGRNAGMLTENVTEERMLLARQMELGRERYKFLSNHMYEKQKFIERQARKQKSMAFQVQRAKKEIEKLSAPRRSITIVMPRVEDVAASHSDVEETSRNADSLANRRNQLQPRAESRGSRISRLSRACSNRSPDGKVAPAKRENTRSSRFTNHACYINSSNVTTSVIYPERQTSSVSPTLSRRKQEQKRVPSVKVGVTRCRTVLPFGRTTQNGVGNSSGSPDLRSGTSPIVNDLAQTDGMYDKKWAVKSSKNPASQYGTRFHSSVTDPRYVALARSLIPSESLPKPRLRVEDIISSKDLLRTKGSKCELNTQRRLMHANFIAYILAELNLK